MEKSFRNKQKQRAGVPRDEIITLENVSKSYSKGAPALNDVTLHVKKGEFVFIVGDSGSGKSTLIKLLLRELTPTKGSINVLGYDLVHIKRRKIPMFRRNLGVVFQDFRLLKDRNVYENVAFAQRVILKSNREIRIVEEIYPSRDAIKNVTAGTRFPIALAIDEEAKYRPSKYTF